MKKTTKVILFCSILFLFSCGEKNTPTPNNSGTGGGTATTQNGKVEVTVRWTSKYQNCIYAWTVECGLGYSSTDVANEAYFNRSSNSSSPTTFTFPNLAPGTYYYKTKKTYNLSTCGGTNQPTTSKSGSFTINSGGTTQVSVSL